MLNIPKVLNCVNSTEEYSRVMEQLQENGLYKDYLRFLDSAITMQKRYEQEQRTGAINIYVKLMKEVIAEVFTKNPEEAFPLEWLSDDRNWLNAWIKKERLIDSTFAYRDVPVKIRGKRSGIRVATFREIILNALSIGLLSGYTTQLQLQAQEYLTKLTSVCFNLFLKDIHVNTQQGINCLYSNVEYCGIVNGRKTAMIRNKNNKGINNLYVKRKYIHLIKNISPEAYEFYSA